MSGKYTSGYSSLLSVSPKSLTSSPIHAPRVIASPDSVNIAVSGSGDSSKAASGISASVGAGNSVNAMQNASSVLKHRFLIQALLYYSALNLAGRNLDIELFRRRKKKGAQSKPRTEKCYDSNCCHTIFKHISHKAMLNRAVHFCRSKNAQPRTYICLGKKCGKKIIPHGRRFIYSVIDFCIKGKDGQ